MSARARFGVRLHAAMAAHGPVCAGIDPHPGLLEAWGLPDDARGLRGFGLRVVEALAGHVAAVKPQSAFFERHGSAGIAALEATLAACSDAGVLSILDVKRGDIGSTMSAYASAHLADGSPLAADAVTLSPYLGFGSLSPALDLAAATGRGVFVLCLTSNPEGGEVQHAIGAGGPVARTIAEHAALRNSEAQPMGDVGLVVGATVGTAAADLGLDLDAVNGPLLAPGFGAQGAGPREVRAVFGRAIDRVLVASSREVLRAGPSVGALRDAVRRIRDAVSERG